MSLDEFAIAIEGARHQQDRLYELALWTAWHIGAFVRASKGKRYPSWESIRREFAKGAAKATQPSSTMPKVQNWQLRQAWVRTRAARDDGQAPKKTQRRKKRRER